MIASYRRWHLRLWLVLVPLLAAGLAVAIVARRPASVEPARAEMDGGDRQ